MKYMANDGKVFDDECECSAYERELESNDAQMEKDLEELDKLEEEIEALHQKYREAIDAFNKKYPDLKAVEIEVTPVFTRGDLFRMLFPFC
jgi:DNA repair exonuclease SbcCD ATPase subunit